MRLRWWHAALLVGIAYCVIGRGFAAPASHIHFWRLAAWVVSGALFLAHIAYEHFRVCSSSRSLAFHAAIAVAIGAFALAVAGFAHSLGGASPARLWYLALIAWPIITAVPAFVAAFVLAIALERVAPRPHV